MVRAVLRRHAAKLPECPLQPFSQRFKTLAETDGDGFDIGVGQHTMEEPMREGRARNRNCQIAHVCEIGLGALSGPMLLDKDHLLLVSV